MVMGMVVLVIEVVVDLVDGDEVTRGAGMGVVMVMGAGVDVE